LIFVEATPLEEQTWIMMFRLTVSGVIRQRSTSRKENLSILIDIYIDTRWLRKKKANKQKKKIHR